MELQIRELLIEAGYDLSEIAVSDIAAGDVDVAGGMGATTREVYAGLAWSFGRYLGNDLKASGISGPVGEPLRFFDPGHREDSRFYLHGVWTLNEESVRHGRTTEGFEDYVALQLPGGQRQRCVAPSRAGAHQCGSDLGLGLCSGGNAR